MTGWEWLVLVAAVAASVLGLWVGWNREAADFVDAKRRSRGLEVFGRDVVDPLPESWGNVRVVEPDDQPES